LVARQVRRQGFRAHAQDAQYGADQLAAVFLQRILVVAVELLVVA